MDSQEQLNQNFELPKPHVDAAGITSPEAGPAPEQQSSTGGESPTAAATVSAPADPTASVNADAPAIAVGHTAALTAQDTDLIEKEWVQKAKEIVAKTHGDPYTQNKEINKMKADYIKKRYNKDIKQAVE